MSEPLRSLPLAVSGDLFLDKAANPLGEKLGNPAKVLLETVQRGDVNSFGQVRLEDEGRRRAA